MYLHVGNDYALPANWVVGIFDLDGTTAVRSENERFLAAAERRGCLEWVGAEAPRSFIVTLDRVYLSPVSALTLRQRWDQARMEYQQQVMPLPADEIQ